MNKKYKRVFSINLQPGYRNYTVKDLQDIKGKRKLTQILVSDALEASAAEEAGIDLILAKPDENVKNKIIIEYLIMDMDLEKFFEHH